MPLPISPSGSGEATRCSRYSFQRCYTRPTLGPHKYFRNRAAAVPAGTWLGAVYDLATIKKWLEVFLYRFVKISQFKRSAILRGPKAGFGGSLSPRGDWRAPSDSEP